MAITRIRLQALHHTVTHGLESIGRICLLVLKKYALMRRWLEVLVKERTEELRLKTIELERQATHDKLTDLFNHRFAAESCRFGRYVLFLCNDRPGNG